MRSVRSRCLITSAVSAIALPALATAPAAAQDYGIHHTAPGPLQVSNPQGALVEGSLIGIFAQGGTLILDNAGTVRGNGSYDGLARSPEGGITIAGSGENSIVNSGSITGAGHGVSTSYYYDPALDRLEGRAIDTSVTNSGTIAGESNDGVRLIGGGSVTNSGTVTGAGNSFADGISIYAYDGQATGGRTGIGAVVNQAGGTIEGVRFGVIVTGGGTIENGGTISGGSAAGGTAGGVVLQDVLNGNGKSGRISNSGTIDGGFGIQVGGGLDNAEVVNSGRVEGVAGNGIANVSSGTLSIRNESAGTIIGATSGVAGDAGPIVLNNAGTIRGNGTYDGLDLPPDAGVVLAQAGSSVVNSGTISGANAGITTRYLYNEETQQLEGLAIGTSIANSGTIRGEANDGIRLIGGGSVTNSGTISGAGGTLADGISAYAYNGQDISTSSEIAQISNAAGGIISGQRYGIILSGGGAIVNDGRIEGTSGAIMIQDVGTGATKTASIVNNGTLVGGVGIAGNITLATVVNSGTINGDVTLGTGNDVLRLATGSSVTGLLDGGEGADRIELAGTSSTLTNLQTLAASQGFEQLDVTSGYWVANSQGASSLFDTVSIGANAVLDVRETSIGGQAASTIVTGNVLNDGLLVLTFNSDDLADIDALAISGSGGVTLAGEANFVVDQPSLTYTGLTTVANGSLTLTGEGTLAGDVLTSGVGTFILGDGGTTGTFTGNLVNDGRFVFNRSDDYAFLGDFSGTGDFTKMGGGLLTFAGNYGFTGITTILGGAVKFEGQLAPETEIDLKDGTLDISGTPQTIASLSGTSSSSINVENSQLTVDQNTNSAFAGSIAGDGALVKSGSGTLNLTGNSTYTGPTTVEAGALAVNGSIVSTVTVNDGGTLKGNGTIGGGNIAAGGQVAPGNSIGTLNVDGDILFAAGSIYEVEVNAAGQSDQIRATGVATIQGGTVEVLAEPGTYRPFTEYLILEADSGVDGEFDTVTTDLAFLTPTLSYDANGITLELLRNDIDFAAIATTDNQASTAGAVEALGVSNPLYIDVALQTEAGALQAFDALSGEVHASIPSALVNDSRHVRDALLGAGRVPLTGAWAQLLGSWGDAGASGGVAGLDHDYQGVIGGLTFGRDAFGGGVAIGTSKTDLDMDGRASSAKVNSTILGAHLSYAAGAVRVQLGGAYAWQDVETDRAIAFPGFSQNATGAYDAKTRQLFAEIGYAATAGQLALEPFVRLEHVHASTDAFDEAGGTAALSLEESDSKVQFLSLGARIGGTLPVSATFTLEPRGAIAWRHGWGDLDGRSTAAFAGATSGFNIDGTRLSKDAAEVELGFDLVSGRFRIGAAYSGSLSDRWSDHGARLNLSFHF